MIQDWKMRLYWRLPVFLQEAALSFYAARHEQINHGPGYQEWRQRFHSWQSWSRADVAAWYAEQLPSIVALAATRVPYYREQWRQVDWQAVQRAALDLDPFVTHERDEFFFVCHARVSSGSSGARCSREPLSQPMVRKCARGCKLAGAENSP